MITLLVAALILAGCSGPLSTLEPAGPSAQAAATLWWGMFIAFATIYGLLVIGWLVVVLRRRRHGTVAPENRLTIPDRPQKTQLAFLVGGGIVLPVTTMTVLTLFSLQAGPVMTGQTSLPEEQLVVEITGHQWWWEVTYPDVPGEPDAETITVRNEVHIPAGVPIRLRLTSADVIHSFWVPRLAGKLDMIPGRVNDLVLTADAPGEYPGLCTEFCGLSHAHMTFTVHVHSPVDFDTWLAAQTNVQDSQDE